jgi:phospholipid/cholesterol/gamma-HCH transport system ATP-binding protein
MVVVTHDLDSIFTIGTRAVFLEAEQKTITDIGDPRIMRDASENPSVREFLNRGRGEERDQRSEVRGQEEGEERRQD